MNEKNTFVDSLKESLSKLKQNKASLINSAIPGSEKSIDEAIAIIDGYIKDFDGLPRICVIGSTGVGKSSLINHILDMPVAETNAIFSETANTSSYLFPKNDPKVEIIDTRGLNEIFNTEDAEKQLIKDLTNKRPHLIIYVTSAYNKSGTDREIAFLKHLIETCKINFGRDIGCVILANKSDGLSPSGFDKLPTPPWEQSQNNESEIIALKRKNLKEKIQWLNNIVENCGITNKPQIVPVALMWTPEKKFWNKDEVLQTIFSVATPSLLFAFGKINGAEKGVADKLNLLTQEIVVRFSIIAATVCWNPIPISDAIILCPLQIAMIELIQSIGGKGALGAWEIFKLVGISSQAGKYLANQLLKFIPVLGNAANSTIASTTTYGIGRIAIAHYVHGWGEEKLETLKDFAQFKEHVETILKKAQERKNI